MKLAVRVAISDNATMHPYFTELGRSVGAAWKQQNFSPASFPKIAAAALRKKPPAEHVDVGELMRDFLLNDEQPFQTDSGFGQPELVVYDDPRFYIQILFWLEGTTDIHQHTFSGAFHVLAGSSIHSHFDFRNAKPVSAHIKVGDVVMRDTQLLNTGSTVPILSGTGFIHALFHLDTPSLTVVVRTHTDPGTGPQFTYLPPGIAVDPFHRDALTNRRKQLLDVMERIGDPAYVEAMLAMLQDLDFERGFFILQNGTRFLQEIGLWNEAVAVFRARHGALAEYVLPTLDEIVRRDTLVGLRSTFTDAEHRFFIALLMNLSRKEDVLSFIQQRFPGDPVEHILRWTEELTAVTDQGVWVLDASFPECLDIPEDAQGTIFRNAVGRALGAKVPKDPLSPAQRKRVKGALAASSLGILME